MQHLVLFIVFFIITLHFSATWYLLVFLRSATLWTKRGHRCLCLRFPPPVHAFICAAQRVQHSHFYSMFIGFYRLTLSHFQQYYSYCCHSLAFKICPVIISLKVRTFCLQAKAAGALHSRPGAWYSAKAKQEHGREQQ